jgi:hypothetical protein
MADDPRTRFDDWHAVHGLIIAVHDHVDAGRFDDAAALFEHASYGMLHRVDDRTEAVTVRGAAAVLDQMQHTIVHDDGTPRTRHIDSNILIELDGDTATSRSYVTVLQQTATLPLQPIATGRYLDRFERVDGQWRFAERLITDFMAGDVSQHASRG